MPTLDWNDYRVLLEVHRAGSFIAAAKRLRVSPSTVMRQVDALERRAGKALFHRTQQGVSLEPDAAPIAAIAEGFELALAAHERDRSNIVRVSVPEGFAALAAEATQRCLQAGVDATVELITDSRYFDLARREADLALRGGRSASRVLIEKRICDLTPALFGSDAYLARHLPSRSLLDGHYGKQAFIADEHLAYGRGPTRWLYERGARNFPFRANTLEARIHAARAGLGLVVLIDRGDYPGLRKVTSGRPAASLPFYLVMHRSLRKVARVQALARAFFQVFEDTPGGKSA